MDTQLSIFARPTLAKAAPPKVAAAKPKTKAPTPTDTPHFTIFVDGASRGNPGPAGAGIFISFDKEPILKKGIYLGEKTNNQAEYLALTLALFYLKNICAEKEVAHPHVAIVSDSELLIKQMKGEYALKNKTLAQLKTVATELLKGCSYHCTHVMREHNKEADKLANLGIDKKHKIPTDFFKILSDYGLSI